MNNGDWTGQPRFGALAVPIRHRGRMLACINIVFSKRATQIEQAAHHYSTDLRTTAAEIERLLMP
jgi:IclR family mhp operon transcriptional activator